MKFGEKNEKKSLTIDETALWNIGIQSIRDLETDEGILASGRDEVFGCVFGRDSLITSLALLRVYQKNADPYLASLVRKVLKTLATLQGQEIIIASGEEPGKCIHEYRPTNHEHLTGENNVLGMPWYVYPDNAMRNYDSVDATPLFLMTIHEYLRVTGDAEFVETMLPAVRRALQWIKDFGDTNGDGFIDYRLHPDRIHGGLPTQSWMDSNNSVFSEDSDLRPEYPIAPVEVQAYTFVALQAWSHFFRKRDESLSHELLRRATRLKIAFNKKFVLKHGRNIRLAFAIDGKGTPLTSPRSSMGHCLWAVWRNDKGNIESVLDDAYIPKVVQRLMLRDLFVAQAGVRTLSSRSAKFDPKSYHNGSIWPHDTAIIAEGLENFGFVAEAKHMRYALLSAYIHFQTPLELFVFDRGKFGEYIDPRGHGACRKQAWSAGALLAVLSNIQE